MSSTRSALRNGPADEDLVSVVYPAAAFCRDSKRLPRPNAMTCRSKRHMMLLHMYSIQFCSRFGGILPFACTVVGIDLGPAVMTTSSALRALASGVKTMTGSFVEPAVGVASCVGRPMGTVITAVPFAKVMVM